MGSDALNRARDKMADAGVDPVAIDVFAHYFRLLEHGETGMIPESAIDPHDMESLADVDVPDDVGARALGTTAVIKLNGGLGTSMGMDRAKSLLCVRRGLSFLDIIARQVLFLREKHDARLPLVFMNSFRTSADTMAALARYEDLPVDGLPLEFLQNKEPKLLAKNLAPATYPKDPDLEWCPPGHGDIYTALLGTGLLDRLIEAGFTQAFVSNSDNLGAVPDPRVAGWFASSGAPFAIEATRRTPSDKKGGHFARRKSDGRIVLRETAQTLPEDLDALGDLERHRYTSTNNLWFDLRAMRDTLRARQGVLGLPLIKNTKHLDPGDPSTPEVIQIETAMGAAIEIFEDSRTIAVERDRFVPVKTTDDLLVLRSDVYGIGKDFVLDQDGNGIPYVALDPEFFKFVGDFDKRFPDGAPSLKGATSFTVKGDWTFGHGVKVEGEVSLDRPDTAQRVAPGTALVPMSEQIVPVADHVARILDAVTPLPAFDQALMDALGLPVAEDVTASLPLPSFDNSAMDGYAVVFKDVADAREDRPVHLPVVGEIGAGQASMLAMSPGTAVKIMTGAPVPQGCTAVVPYEWTDRGVAHVQISKAPTEGQHIRRAGEDVEEGDVLISEGTVLGPRQLGLLAAAGRASVKSRPRPRVVVMSTGTELREPGMSLGHDSIYDANSYMLAAAVTAAGGIAYRVGAVADDVRGFTEALTDQLVRADIVVTSGGVSQGDYDVVKEALAGLGTVWFGGVAMQPGKPQGFGVVGDDETLIFTLPGNPVSAYVSFQAFVLPALRKMQGRRPHERPTRTARITHGMSSIPGRQQMVRGQYDASVVTPVGGHGSHLIGDLADANCLIVVPAETESLAPGDSVQVLLLDEDF